MYHRMLAVRSLRPSAVEVVVVVAAAVPLVAAEEEVPLMVTRTPLRCRSRAVADEPPPPAVSSSLRVAKN